MTTQTFMSCNGKWHKCSGSVYSRDKVPSNLFENALNDTFYKSCFDCRRYNAKQCKKIPSSQRDTDEYGLFMCRTCNIERTKDFCRKCTDTRSGTLRTRNKNYILVMWERILETGCCCQRCKRVFLKKKDGSVGFTVVDSMDNVTKDDIEFRNLEFDHLTWLEQIMYFGKYYGEKVCGVANIHSYASKKTESKKCLLVCLLCHTFNTAERITETVCGKRKSTQRKIDYVNSKKVEIGCCELCRHSVNQSNLSYFEFDHKNPENKQYEISAIVNQHSSHFTLEFLIEELSDCRLLCRYCHRIQSGTQTRERYGSKRTKDKEVLVCALKQKLHDLVKSTKQKESIRITVPVRKSIQKRSLKILIPIFQKRIQKQSLKIILANRRQKESLKIVLPKKWQKKSMKIVVF